MQLTIWWENTLSVWWEGDEGWNCVCVCVWVCCIYLCVCMCACVHVLFPWWEWWKHSSFNHVFWSGKQNESRTLSEDMSSIDSYVVVMNACLIMWSWGKYVHYFSTCSSGTFGCRWLLLFIHWFDILEHKEMEKKHFVVCVWCQILLFLKLSFLVSLHKSHNLFLFRTHTCMYARMHAHTHTCTHFQLNIHAARPENKGKRTSKQGLFCCR